jgi:hypothetical protein
VKADIFNRYFPSHGAKGIIQEWMAHINGVCLDLNMYSNTVSSDLK